MFYFLLIFVLPRDEGGILFGNVLRVNNVLKVLNLNGNSLGDATAAAFAEAIQLNHTLNELYLDKNAMTSKGRYWFYLGEGRGRGSRQE